MCFTSACVWSSIQSTYVAGGDGVSIQNYIDGGGSYGGNVAKIVERSRIVEAGAADVVPEVGTLLPLLGTITLGATAFEVGWKIGSTVNTKWLHLAGVGLGHTASDPNGLTATPQWVPSTNLHAVYSGFPAAVGWWLKFFNDGSTSYFDLNECLWMSF